MFVLPGAGAGRPIDRQNPLVPDLYDEGRAWSLLSRKGKLLAICNPTKNGSPAKLQTLVNRSFEKTFGLLKSSRKGCERSKMLEMILRNMLDWLKVKDAFDKYLRIACTPGSQGGGGGGDEVRVKQLTAAFDELDKLKAEADRLRALDASMPTVPNELTVLKTLPSAPEKLRQLEAPLLA